MATPTGWQKILYRKQPFPDNYSGGDAQFLKELRKNGKLLKVFHLYYPYAKFTVFALLGNIYLILAFVNIK